MALIFCPECGTQVSEHAEQCVKCAYPIKDRTTNHLNKNHEFNDYEDEKHFHVSNTIIWIVAFAPIIGNFLQGFVYGFMSSFTNSFYNYSKFWWVTLFLNVILCYADEKRLKNSGVDTSKITSWAIWLVPVYLYKRAEILNQNQSYFWVWLATFIFSFYL